MPRADFAFGSTEGLLHAGHDRERLECARPDERQGIEIGALERKHTVVFQQHGAPLGCLLNDARVRLDVLRNYRVMRRVVEPAETFQLSQHVPGRAIKVCFDDAAAREGLAELAETASGGRGGGSGRTGSG